MAMDNRSAHRGGRLPPGDRAGRDAPAAGRRPSWVMWTSLAVLYAVAGVGAHFLPVRVLGDLTVAAYVAAEVGGLAFIVRYARTDWRAHPWGRHVMTFMVCLEVLFTLALSRRVFGLWPGLAEVGLLASVTFAGIVWWRYKLQADGDRAARSADD